MRALTAKVRRPEVALFPWRVIELPTLSRFDEQAAPCAAHHAGLDERLQSRPPLLVEVAVATLRGRGLHDSHQALGHSAFVHEPALLEPPPQSRHGLGVTLCLLQRAPLVPVLPVVASRALPVAGQAMSLPPRRLRAVDGKSFRLKKLAASRAEARIVRHRSARRRRDQACAGERGKGEERERRSVSMVTVQKNRPCPDFRMKGKDGPQGSSAESVFKSGGAGSARPAARTELYPGENKG